MTPALVSHVLSLGGGRRVGRITICPLSVHKVVKLLGPEHTGKGLSLDVSEVVADGHGVHVEVKVISFLASLVKLLVKSLFVEGLVSVDLAVSKLESNSDKVSGGDTVALIKGVPGTSLGSGLLGVDGIFVAVDNVLVEAILAVLGLFLLLAAVQLLLVGLVVCKEKLRGDVIVGLVVLKTRRVGKSKMSLSLAVVLGLDQIFANLGQGGDGLVLLRN